MGTQVTGRKRIPNREKVSAEDDALSQIAREAEARLAAKRAARAEAREIRLKELERQQKEIYQSQKKYYGLDSKWGHIEQWMEDSERYSRHSRRHTSISDDEERMSVGSRGSLRPSDYGAFLGSSSRASSRASSARASPVVEERADFMEKGSRTASTLSAATLASLGGGFSRRGSCDTSISADTEASIRDMKDSLVEAEEKYRKAMVSNAQLDNEKSNLMYQVDTLRDTLLELEELLYETRRECEEKSKDFERERHAHKVLRFQFDELKESLNQSEELLKDAQGLRVKQAGCVREIADLQETLEWKEKKIRALERQKEYTDIIRDERDALKEEVFRLRDALKKHGISPGSEVTTNGESDKNMTNGPEHEESAHDTPTSSDSMLERSPEDQASAVVPTTKKTLFIQKSGATTDEEETRWSSVGQDEDVEQTEGFGATKDDESQMEKTTEKSVEKMETPGTSKTCQDLGFSNIELIKKEDPSSSSERERSEAELDDESTDIQPHPFTTPVEEKGIASLLDSCQEALELHSEFINVEAQAENQGQAAPAEDQNKPNMTSPRNKIGQDCSVS